MLKVLIVDDESIVRKGIMMEVDWQSLDCIIVGEAANGLEGIDQAERLKPDLIITDIRMPKLDGIEMVRRLRANDNKVQVIFLTAYSDFTYAQNAIKLFAADYLLKPFADGELEAAVTKVKSNLESMPAKEKKSHNKAAEYIISLSPSRYVVDAVSYVAKNCNNSELCVSMIADSLCVSEGHLSRLFKAETGSTLNSFITSYRIEEAKKLLSDNRTKVYEVAAMVGYKDNAYFATLFKKNTGFTPSEFQKNED